MKTAVSSKAVGGSKARLFFGVMAAALVLLTLGLGLAGCNGKSPQKSIVGTWEREINTEIRVTTHPNIRKNMNSNELANLIDAMFSGRLEGGMGYKVTISGKYTIQFNSNGTYMFWNSYTFPSNFNLNTINVNDIPSDGGHFSVDGARISNYDIDMQEYEGFYVIDNNTITLNDNRGVRNLNISFSDDRNTLILSSFGGTEWLQKVND